MAASISATGLRVLAAIQAARPLTSAAEVEYR